MACPVCSSGQIEHTILAQGEVECEHCIPYRDPTGHFHPHWPGRDTIHRHCSNGHDWFEAQVSSCRCGWVSDG